MNDNANGAPWWTVRTEKDLSTKLSPRNPMAVALAFMVVLLVGALAFWGMTAISPSKTRPGSYGSTEHFTSISAVLNQCGNIFVFPVEEAYVGTYEPADITPDENGERKQPLLPTVIQTYGFMRTTGLPEDKPYYNPKESEKIELGHVLRSMYDGKIIIWYRHDLIQEDLTLIRDYAWANKDRVIAIAREGNFPQGRSVAFATWGVTMSCGLWEETIVDEFIAFVDDNYNSVIPSEPPPTANIKDGKFPGVVLNPFE